MTKKKEDKPKIGFNFQINFIGAGQGKDEDDIKRLVLKQIKKLTKADLIKATDYFFLKDGNLTKSWLDGRPTGGEGN